MTTQIKAGVIAANAVNSSELASGALSGQNFTGDVTFDTTTLFVDSTNNRVGIGTASPTTGKLVIDADNNAVGLRLNGGTTTGQSFGSRIRAGTNSSDYGLLVEDTSANTILVARGNGNVGIGTSSPDSMLHLSAGSTGVSGGGSAAITMTNKFDNPDNSWIIAPVRSGVSNTGLEIRDVTDSRTDMVFDGSGNVGIGTTSPADNLHVKGAGATLIRLEQGNGSNYGLIKQNQSLQALQLGVGGDFAMTIRNSENVGIGTDSPSEALTVAGHVDLINTAINLNFMETGVTDSNHRIRQNAGNLYFQKLSDDKGTATDRIVLDGGTGNVGIGTSSPIGVLTVDYGTTTQGGGVSFRRNSTQRWDFYANSGGNALYSEGNDGYFGTSSAHNVVFVTNETERMRILSNGVFLIGTTSQSGISNTTTNYGVSIGGGQYVVNTDDDTNFIINRSNGTGNHIQFRYNGGNTGSISTNGSTVSYNTGSDYRLKENVNYDFNALDRVAQLKPARFNFIADADTTVDGFLAHEVQDIVPEAISGEKDAVDDEGNPEYQGIDHSKLVPLLTKAIQEQQTIIDDLKSRLDEAGL